MEVSTEDLPMAELRKRGSSSAVNFPLITKGRADFDATPVTFASGDTQISKDQGAFANTSNNPSHEGNGTYSLALTATELTCSRAVVTMIDQTDPKAWEDQAVNVDTYGHPSAQHEFDLDGAAPNVTLADAVEHGGATATAVINGIISGTASGTPTATTTPASDLPSSLDTDHYKDRTIVFLDGDRIGAAKLITGYNGGTKVLTHEAFTSTGAASGDTFKIV